MLIKVIYNSLLVLSISNSKPSNVYKLDVGMVNTPGVYCRTVELAMVYSEPQVSSRVLGRTLNFIAVTGKEVNGFFPILTGSGVKGWVMVNQTLRENSFEGRPCRVQVLPDGRLLFGPP